MSSKIEQLANYFQTIVGTKKVKVIGQIDSLLIRRYALAIGDQNPLYHDKEYAQKYGYKDVVAPPNLLASIIEWGRGLEEEHLHRDGMPKEGFLPKQFDGIKIMGGGEKKQFFKPLVAGTKITLTNEITNAYIKEGKKGLVAFLEETNTYTDENNKVICISIRTNIAR
nr:MaoC family dehydratase N-terminal domain-containing protein [Fredinandcohnia onubensis]